MGRAGYGCADAPAAASSKMQAVMLIVMGFMSLPLGMQI